MAKALTTTVETFDYSELKKDDKGKLMCLAAEVRRKIEAGRRTAFEIGESVACAHAILAIDGKDGKFSKWVEFEFGFSRQTAYNLMWSWERFGNCKTILQLDDSAMYALASPTVPEPAVKAAIKLAEKQRVTFGEVKEIIKQHTPDAPPKPTKTKSQASVSGSDKLTPSDAPPSLPSVGEGSQGDGDAGECPHGGPHDFLEGACMKCHEPDDAAPVTIPGGPSFPVDVIEKVKSQDDSVKEMFATLKEHIRQTTLLLDKINNATGRKFSQVNQTCHDTLEIVSIEVHKWAKACK